MIFLGILFLVLAVINLLFAVKNLAFSKGSKVFGFSSYGDFWGFCELVVVLLLWGATLYCFDTL